MLDGVADIAGLGQHFGGLLYAREAEFLRETEWARRPEDVLQRRTKHSLHMKPAEQARFAAWWNANARASADSVTILAGSAAGLDSLPSH